MPTMLYRYPGPHAIHGGMFDYRIVDEEQIDEALAEQIAQVVRSIRALDVKKAPSVSETIDWARTLLYLGHTQIDPEAFYNIVKNPTVELQDGTANGDYQAREVFGDEKAAWWKRAVEVWPAYDEYQGKTEREIPVFVLTPIH